MDSNRLVIYLRFSKIYGTLPNRCITANYISQKYRTVREKKREKKMPVRIIQSNDRVAEAQFICDSCGKHIKTSLIPKQEAEKQQKQPVICWQCKQATKMNLKLTFNFPERRASASASITSKSRTTRLPFRCFS